MKNIFLTLYVVLVGIVLISCTKKDTAESNSLAISEDIIIGQWRPIEKYESNQKIELPTCRSYSYLEFLPNNTFFGNTIYSSDYPEECGISFSEYGLTWLNLGNNKYLQQHNLKDGKIYTYYKDGVNLVEELPDGITKIIYEPYITSSDRHQRIHPTYNLDFKI